MIKLQYNATYKFNTADIYILSEPPIEFEAVSRAPAEWARLNRVWQEDGMEDAGRAMECLAMVLRYVSQGDDSAPIRGREDVEALRAAIEESGPGQGDEFIKHLCLGHYNYHFNRMVDLMGNSDEPSPVSGDGSDRNGTDGRTAKQPKRRPARQSSGD